MTKRTPIKNTKRPVAANPAAVRAKPKQNTYNPWSMSIYVYWFIILFFIAATFYILGRSHGVLDHRVPLNNEVTVSEEMLMGPADYYQSGKTKLVSGEIEDAIVDLTAAIDSGTPTPDMYVLRGEAYMQSGDYRGALDDFNTAIEMDPTSSVAYYDRALLNTRLEDYNAAWVDINNALAARASNDQDLLQLRDLYAKRGQLNLWLKNWDGAIADYTNSLTHPEGVVNPSVYAERAEAYTAVGNYLAAIADYDAAVRSISEQVNGVALVGERESMSANAMSYLEKSAALKLSVGDIIGARDNLNSALQLAVALNDADSVDRINTLISGIPE